MGRRSCDTVVIITREWEEGRVILVRGEGPSGGGGMGLPSKSVGDARTFRS